ncbi:MAG: ATP-binding protein [Acidobacteria bacterium]|nr:ATP-binding protein [Acidobacteriota bacterium]
MAVFQRAQVGTLLSRLAEPPGRIIALFGPRQTGKTTIVRQALGQIEQPSRYVAVDEPESPAFRLPPPVPEAFLPRPEVRNTEWLVRMWEEARRGAQRSPTGFVLVLDEIQKIPRWSETVKGLWDADRAAGRLLHVVILGSSPLLMQSGLTESLAGRFEPISVTHWSFLEMTDAYGFDLPTYLYFGGYPGAVSRIDDQARWRDYILKALVEPNIERDVLAMTRVDKPALLKRLFELCAAASGQIVSYNKMLGPLQDAGNTTTLARYLELLAGAGLLAGLPKYAKSPVWRGSSPKLNVLNTALMTAHSGYTFEEAQADRTFWGRVVESAVGAHLSNTAASGMRVYYWRHRSHEVDFVLQRGPHVVAMEVKSGPRRRSPHGLAAFEERFKPLQTLIVGAGGIPLDEFLAAPAARWLEEG